MKTFFTLLLILLTHWNILAQVLRAPADVVISCHQSQNIDQMSLENLNHPIFGSIRFDSSLVDSIITIDVVCPEMCMPDPQILYLEDEPVFERACQFFQNLGSDDLGEVHNLFWGLDGYAEGFDSIEVVIGSPHPGQLESNRRNKIRRFFTGYIDGKPRARVHQNIYYLYCNRFDINIDDRTDTTDCIDFSLFDSIRYVFLDRKQDSLVHSDYAFVDTLCGECGLVAIDYSEERIFDNQINFYIVKRKWTAIDWMVYDPINPNDGRWELCQTIYVFYSDGNLHGQLYYDANNNCALDSNEYGLRNWRIQAAGSTDTFQTFTDYRGKYVLPLFFNDYEITAYPPNRAWSTCLDSWSVSLDSMSPMDTLMIGATADTLCRDARVELEAIQLKYCSDNRYYLEVGNNGTNSLSNAIVSIEIPPFFQAIDASVPYSTPSAGTLELSIGDLGIGEWQPHYFDVRMDCDSVSNEDVICLTAEINPTDSCGLDNYRGPIIEAEAECIGDSVKLILTNVGQDMKTTLDFWVVEDDLILFMDVVDLDSNQNKEISLFAEGATYHIVCQQDPDFPNDPYVVSGIQGCNALGGLNSKGILNHLGINSPYDNIDIYCAEFDDEFDLVSKKAFPIGSGPSHEIRKDQRIEYTIAFANQTGDTIRKVRIQDFLDAHIDVNSIQVLSSSHPYEMAVLSSDTSNYHGIEFFFDDIVLPDSASDRYGSRGFIKFSVRPNKLISDGDSLINHALVFFDHNAGLETETVFHTISGKLTSAFDYSDHHLDSDIRFWPNPLENVGYLEVDGRYFDRTYRVQMVDVHGRILARANSYVPRLTMHWWSRLQSGHYIIRVITDKNQIFTRKVIKL